MCVHYKNVVGNMSHVGWFMGRLIALVIIGTFKNINYAISLQLS